MTVIVHTLKLLHLPYYTASDCQTSSHNSRSVWEKDWWLWRERLQWWTSLEDYQSFQQVCSYQLVSTMWTILQSNLAPFRHYQRTTNTPANTNTRLDELSNIESWAQGNNMKLNRSKSAEIIFTNRRRRQQVDEPPPLTDITRVSSIKILGVTISNRLSLSQHVQNVAMLCAQTVHIPNILCICSSSSSVDSVTS